MTTHTVLDQAEQQAYSVLQGYATSFSANTDPVLKAQQIKVDIESIIDPSVKVSVQITAKGEAAEDRQPTGIEGDLRMENHHAIDVTLTCEDLFKSVHLNALHSDFIATKSLAVESVVNTDQQPQAEPDIMQYFSYNHLPQHLQEISKQFYDLATNMLLATSAIPEQSAGLRKLLEAKDCMVRAALPKQ